MFQAALKNVYASWIEIGLLILAFGIFFTITRIQNNNSINLSIQEIKATPAKDVRPLNPHFLGCNVNLIRGGSWKSKELQTFANKLCATIRYPAGTIANWWDWKTGWFKTELSNIPRQYANITPNPYTLNELKVIYEVTGADLIFNLNILTSDLNDQINMLQEAKKLGLPVKWIELGNEFYLDNEPAHEKRFSYAEDYGKEATNWSKSIKNEFPTAKVAVVGAIYNSWKDSSRKRDWNSSLIPELSNIDAITLHWYLGTSLPPYNIWKTFGVKNKDRGFSAEPAIQEIQQKIFQKKGGLIDLLGQPYLNFTRLQGQIQTEIPINYQLWITEYNLIDRIGVVPGTWAHGLFTAGMTLNLLRESRIYLACIHDLSSGIAPFSLTYGFSGRNINQPTGLTAIGHAVALLQSAMRGKTMVESLNFEPLPTDRTSGEQEYPVLVGWIFSNQKSFAVILMNLSDKTMQITAKDWVKPGTTWVQLSADPTKIIQNDADLNTILGKMEKSITLFAYSLTKIGGVSNDVYLTK